MQLRAPGVLHAVARPEHLVHAGRPLEGDRGVEAGLLATVQYSSVQLSTVEYSTVQCSTVVTLLPGASLRICTLSMKDTWSEGCQSRLGVISQTFVMQKYLDALKNI